MAPTASAADDRRPLRRSVVVTWGLLTVVFTVLLLPPFPLSMRESVSGLGLLVGGVTAAVSLGLRARRSEGGQARPWWLLASAAVVAILGNIWVTITGADPVSSPSLLGDLTIAAALVLSTCLLYTSDAADE